MVWLLCKNIKNFWNKTWNNIQAKYANHKEGFRRFFQELERQNVNIQLVMKSRNGPWEFMQLPRRWQRLQLPVATILFEVMSRSGDKNHFKLAQLCRDGASGTIGDVGNPEKNMMKQILKRWWIMMNHWNCFLIIVDPIFTPILLSLLVFGETAFEGPALFGAQRNQSIDESSPLNLDFQS